MIDQSDLPEVVSGPGTYYHSVHTAPGVPLDPKDFRSQTQRGRKPRGTRANDPTYIRWFNGVSVHDTPEQTRRNAEYFDWKIGEFIAELVIPKGTDVAYERLDDDGHGNTVPA